MYSTCLFCHGALGANGVFESFPVGRRLAFDATKGRLWVVCPACAQWNLTPLEERWEAVEACERRFRGTRIRASTGEIGAARLREGLDLIRIGAPLRPELSAWRYGAQFRRRRQRFVMGGIGGAAAMAASAPLLVPIVAPLAPTFLVAAGFIYWTAPWSVPLLMEYAQDERVMARVRDADGQILTIRAKHMPHLRLDTWHRDDSVALYVVHDDGRLQIAGAAGRQAARVLFARTNRRGASRRDIQNAVDHLEHVGDAVDYLAIATQRSRPRRGRRLMSATRNLSLFNLSPIERLAVEMALHEEEERRAMDGSLATLTAAWREAEEVAAIADSMLLPAPVKAWMDRHRHT